MPTRAAIRGSGILSSDCEPLRRRLAQWRATRPHVRAPMPEPLWAEAADLARRHGVAATSRTLRLGYDGLKRRVGPPLRAVALAPTFVELPPPTPDASASWVVEFLGPDGRVVRVQVPPLALSDLVRLGRAAWSGA